MSEMISAATFSYAALTPEAETVARSAAEAIKSVTARSVVEIGRHLIVTKEALPHGAFTAWVEAELGMTSRAGRNYMAAAEWLEGKPETISALPPTIIYTLARPNTPVELVDEVVAMGKAGEVDLTVVRQRLYTLSCERFELRLAQRRNPKLTGRELRERKEKRRQQAERDYAREEVKREREEDARRVRLSPLAEHVASLGAKNAEALFAAVEHYQDRLTLIERVREILAAGSA